jgi:hypothetical protein
MKKAQIEKTTNELTTRPHFFLGGAKKENQEV